MCVYIIESVIHLLHRFCHVYMYTVIIKSLIYFLSRVCFINFHFIISLFGCTIMLCLALSLSLYCKYCILMGLTAFWNLEKKKKKKKKKKQDTHSIASPRVERIKIFEDK